MKETTKMPVVFVGHGSPMYTLEHQGYIDSWRHLGRRLPEPKGILCISAHWVTEGLMTLCQPTNKMIYDFYGFPKDLYQVAYPTQGILGIDHKLRDQLEEKVSCGDWGLDHGTWSVLRHMYPEGNIPVTQVSIPRRYSPKDQWDLGRRLGRLREEGFLIMGSGNIIHNLSLMDPSLAGKGNPWAEKLKNEINQALLTRQDHALIQYENFGPDIHKAFRTTEHYYPLLAVLGASEGERDVELFNDDCVFGSLSMTSAIIGLNPNKD